MTESYKGITLRQKARVLPADMDTPISLFMGMAGAGDGILLESAAVDGRWGPLQHSGLRHAASDFLPGRKAQPPCR